MKNCITLSILLSLLIKANAQENTADAQHRIAFAMGVNYLFPQADNDLNIAAKEAGFNGSFTYTIDFGKVGLQLSPFAKLHTGEDFEGMKQYYKEKNITLTSYNGGTYLSSGMAIGLEFTLVDNGKLPVISTYLQYGMSSVRVPELQLNSETELETVMVRTDAGLALGSNLNVGINADVFKSGNSIYSVKIGIMNENANVAIPTTTFTDVTTRSVEIFPWRSLSGYLNLSMAFDL
ncbi:MAG: hypothetical protein IPO24_00225 [Bacteroidetes bacterium]|nr:hypothetical protein [Bacteroidota bacterium]